MLKQKMMKIALTTTMLGGVIGSIEIIKPSTASAQTFGGATIEWGQHFSTLNNYTVINVKRLPDTPVVKVDEMTPFGRTTEHTAKFTNKKIETTSNLFEISGESPLGTGPLSKLITKLGAKYTHTRTNTVDATNEYGMKIIVRNPEKHTALGRFIEGRVETTEVTSKNEYNNVKKEIIKTFVPTRVTLAVVERNTDLEKEIIRYNHLNNKSEYDSINVHIFNKFYNAYRR